VTTGLPVQEIRNAEAGTTDENQVSWYQHALNYLARRREGLSGNSLRSIAETLTTVTIKLLTPGPGQPTDVLLREALYGWAYRNRAEPPAEIVTVLDWVAAHSRPLADLADTDLVLDVLEALSRKLDGKRAAANTIARKRAALSNVLDYGIGRGLDTNLLPNAAKMWNQPKTTEGMVDPRVVVNRRQAEALLTAVSYQGRVGPRLIAFFACLYYAGLRPSEAVELREDLNIDLPEDDGWGTLYLHRSAPTVGTGWSRSGRRRDPRELKHRASGTVRPFLATPPWRTTCAGTWPSSAPPPTADCSAATGAGISPRACTAGFGRAPGGSPSLPPWPLRPLPGAPTTCATPACPHGSTPALTPLRSLSGPATASMSCFASTPSASTAATNSTGSASKAPSATTDDDLATARWTTCH
jgi:hypothetical protein